MQLPREPLYVAIRKCDGKAVTGFGWCYSDYTDDYLEELGQSIQDIYLYTKNGVVLCLGDSAERID